VKTQANLVCQLERGQLSFSSVMTILLYFARCLERYARQTLWLLAADYQALTDKVDALLPGAPELHPAPVPQQFFFALEAQPLWAHVRTYSAYFWPLPDGRYRYLAHLIDNDSRAVVYFSSAPYLAPLLGAVESFLGNQGLVLQILPTEASCPEPPRPEFSRAP
jgi:hypothetical protein